MNTKNENIRMLPKEEFIKTVRVRSKLQGITDPDEFLGTISEKIKKDYDDHLISQECEGTFEVKDGKVTNINLSGIALIPIRRG